ncbi:MAG: NUDIX hydrolase [Candidatus Saccharimonadales bacterium]
MLRKLGFMLLWPGLFLYFLGSKRARVVLRHDDEILLIRDSSRYFSDQTLWTLPGGGIHAGEEATDAAVRELHEELGVSIEPDILRFLSRERSGGYRLRYTAYFYDAQVTQKPKLVVPSKEVCDAQWFSIEAASQLPLKREAYRVLQLLAEQR